MSGRKTNDNTQFALVSADGTRATAGFAPLLNGDGAEPIADPDGRLFVLTARELPGFPTPWQFSAAALAASFLVQSGPRVLTGATGFNAEAALTLYAQVYDLAASPPGASDVPVQSIPVQPLAAWSWSPPDGWLFVNGIVIAISTSPLLFVSPPPGPQLFANAQGWAP